MICAGCNSIFSDDTKHVCPQGTFLKRCPFCGSSATVWGEDKPFNPDWKLSRVICDNKDCGMAGRNWHSHAEAIQAWDTRI